MTIFPMFTVELEHGIGLAAFRQRERGHDKAARRPGRPGVRRQSQPRDVAAPTPAPPAAAPPAAPPPPATTPAATAAAVVVNNERAGRRAQRHRQHADEPDQRARRHARRGEAPGAQSLITERSALSLSPMYCCCCC